MKHHYAFSARSIPLLLAVLCFLLPAQKEALAYPTGITGYTTSGCTCHSPGQSSNTSLSFSSASGSFTVSPGGELTVTLTVAHSSQSAAGTDIGVVNSSNQNAGTLSPASGSGLYLSNSELTHSSAKSMSGGQASFTFTWTAPSTPGTYTIRAAGNAVNQNGNSSGDYYNTATQSITVSAQPAVTLTAPNGGEQWCGGSSQNITWTSTSVTNVKIELSSNGGSSYPTTLVASTPASAGSWAWNIPAGQTIGDQYRIRISDASNASVNDASATNFSIKGATAISQHPESQTGCEGTPVSFTVAASGANLTYQWRKDGTNINGANSATYTIASPAAASAGSYDVVVNGNCGGSVTSNAASLTVRGRPTITEHPASYSVCAGQSVTLAVTATGDNLTYQWRHEGAPVAGATESSYTIASAVAGDAGRYDVVVSGTCSPAATSNFGIVQIASPAAITQQPQSQTVCENSTVSLTVEATGVQSYIWRKNGVTINGATGPTYTISSAGAGAEGAYTVTVMGLCDNDSVVSQVATLDITRRPAITQQPVNVTVLEGSPMSLSVIATGATLSYQWKKNGTDIDGATERFLSITNTELSDAGSYTVLVSNSCGTVTSATAVVTVTPAGPGPVLALSSNLLNFEVVVVDSQREKTVTVSNSGTEDLVISAIEVEGDNAGDFTIVDMPSLPVTLTPATGSLELTIRFSPAAEGDKTGELVFTSNAIVNPTVSLSGVGAVVSVAPVAGSTTEFGTVEVGADKTVDIVIKNTGIIPARISAVTLGGTNGNLFSVESISPAVPAELLPSQEMTISVTYTPMAAGTVTAQLSATVDGMASPVVVELTGEAVPSTSVRGEAIATTFGVAPNPVTDYTVIRLSGAQGADISVVDESGRTIRSLGRTEATEQAVRWDGRDDSGRLCAAGMYRVVLSLNGRIQTIPVVLTR